MGRSGLVKAPPVHPAEAELAPLLKKPPQALRNDADMTDNDDAWTPSRPGTLGQEVAFGKQDRAAIRPEHGRIRTHFDIRSPCGHSGSTSAGRLGSQRLLGHHRRLE